MTFPLAPIGAVSPISALTTTASTAPVAPAAGSGGDFAAVLARGLDSVSATQAHADTLAVQAATGQLTDPAQYTIAATQASLMTQLATTIENKAVSAFNTIMGMQA